MHWLGPWRQHLMTNYGLRQNHRKIIAKTKKSAFCVRYSVPLSQHLPFYINIARICNTLSRYKKECTYAQQNITKYNINSNINVAYKINEFDYSVSIPYEKYHPTLLFCLLNASQLR